MTKLKLSASFITILIAAFACSAGSGADSEKKQSGKNSGSGGSGPKLGTGGGGPIIDVPDSGTEGGDEEIVPKTCEEAAAARSYVGCEFWPTIVANPVWKDFEPAVVIANGGDVEATVKVEGPGGFSAEEKVPPGGLQTIMLKWVEALKGPEFSRTNTQGGRLEQSARADKSAYKLTSSVPVTAWQFNPLRYTSTCAGIGECRAASNDASLLLPASAMTGNYRVFAYSSKNEGKAWGTVPGGFSITATRDNTDVKVQLGPKCGVEDSGVPGELGVCVAAGPGVDAKKGGEIYDFKMNAGDVVQLVGAWAKWELSKNADVSGSIVNASQPVQVVAFNAISQLPDHSVANADHMEETVLPAEVIGNKYIVVPPTTPNGNAVGHVVRIYGNVDNTHLTYPAGKPPGAPDVINAGDVVQIPPLPAGECVGNAAACVLNEPFIVEGDQSFSVNSFMVGGVLQMPGTDATNSKGDPSMSQMVTPAQFRKEYTFLAPSDYTENFAEVLVPDGAEVLLDGAAISAPLEKIGSSEWSYARVKLEGGNNGGVHKIATTDKRGIGLQVAGFGFATSYYYPGGLNLKLISVPPVIVVK